MSPYDRLAALSIKARIEAALGQLAIRHLSTENTFICLLRIHLSVDWRENVVYIIDEVPVGCPQSTALYHQATLLVHIEDHVGVDTEGFVCENIPGLTW